MREQPKKSYSTPAEDAIKEEDKESEKDEEEEESSSSETSSEEDKEGELKPTAKETDVDKQMSSKTESKEEVEATGVFGKTKVPRNVANEYGEFLGNYQWDGPDDSDEEIKEMVEMKTQWEKDNGIKFSKKGIIKAINDMIKSESKLSPDSKIAKAWE